jgi:hypothetical protein
MKTDPARKRRDWELAATMSRKRSLVSSVRVFSRPTLTVVCPCRGLPDESSKHGRSNGQLYGYRGSVLTETLGLPVIVVACIVASVIAECRETK